MQARRRYVDVVESVKGNDRPFRTPNALTLPAPYCLIEVRAGTRTCRRAGGTWTWWSP